MLNSHSDIDGFTLIYLVSEWFSQDVQLRGKVGF